MSIGYSKVARVGRLQAEQQESIGRRQNSKGRLGYCRKSSRGSIVIAVRCKRRVAIVVEHRARSINRSIDSRSSTELELSIGRWTVGVAAQSIVDGLW